VAGDDEWSAAPHEVTLNHLVLVVHELPTDSCPEGAWLVDAGLGDAIHEPLPLVEGEHRQGPFRFALGAAAGRTGWRLRHHHAGSFAAMEFEAAPAVLADFDEVHRDLSTSATSPFTGTFTAQRRDEDGVDILRGRHLIRIDSAGRVERDVADLDGWIEVVRESFGLSGRLAEALWPRVAAAHRDWLARQDADPPAPTQPTGPANALQDAAAA
jgi:arylamine N-acetyltransferase